MPGMLGAPRVGMVVAVAGLLGSQIYKDLHISFGS